MITMIVSYPTRIACSTLKIVSGAYIIFQYKEIFTVQSSDILLLEKYHGNEDYHRNSFTERSYRYLHIKDRTSYRIYISYNNEREVDNLCMNL